MKRIKKQGFLKSPVVPAKAELLLTAGKKSLEKTILIIKRLRVIRNQVQDSMTKTLFRTFRTALFII